MTNDPSQPLSPDAPIPRLAYSLPEVAVMFGVSLTTVYTWRDKGVVRPVRIGGRVWVLARDLDALVDRLSETGGIAFDTYSGAAS